MYLVCIVHNQLYSDQATYASIAWFPFADFQRVAKVSVKDASDMRDKPFEEVLESIVRVVSRMTGIVCDVVHRTMEPRRPRLLIPILPGFEAMKSLPTSTRMR